MQHNRIHQWMSAPAELAVEGPQRLRKLDAPLIEVVRLLRDDALNLNA